MQLYTGHRPHLEMGLLEVPSSPPSSAPPRVCSPAPLGPGERTPSAVGGDPMSANGDTCGAQLPTAACSPLLPCKLAAGAGAVGDAPVLLPRVPRLGADKLGGAVTRLGALDKDTGEAPPLELARGRAVGWREMMGGSCAMRASAASTCNRCEFCAGVLCGTPGQRGGEG